MKLSIIIPVFNESQTIISVLTKLTSLKLPCEKEIIIVDDGSTDGTRKRIRNYELGIMKKRTTVFHKKNQGKGVAVRSGIQKATGDYILIQDADLEYNPEEILKLLAPIVKPTTLNLQPTTNIAVYGSRFMGTPIKIPLLYRLGNNFLTILTNILYGTKLTDMETGYKLLPASFFKNISFKSKRFDIEPEITARLIKAKIPIIEVPITYHGRTHLAGKKLTIPDAIGAIKTLVSLRFFR